MDILKERSQIWYKLTRLPYVCIEQYLLFFIFVQENFQLFFFSIAIRLKRWC